MALVAASVTLFYCLFLFQGYQKLFRDSDAGWHIRNGETIALTGRLPHTDPYSFTRPGQPWFAWEWAADVAAGLAHRWSGLTGVALLYAAAIAAGVWLWFRLHWALGGNFFGACLMASLLLSTCNIHWLARPHVFSWLFFLGALFYCERRRGPFTWREALAVALYTALWANLHASFFFGAVIAFLYAAGRRSRPLAWAAAIACVAPLANPYGASLYLHVWRYLTDTRLLAHIGEYQSFNFHADGSGQIIAALILGIMGGAVSLLQGRVERFLMAVVFTALALRSARVLPLDALLLLPLANAAFTEALKNAGRLPEFLAYSARLRAIDARQSGLAWAPLLLLASFGLLRTPAIRAATGFAPDQFPVAAYAHIPPAARLFAPDKYGGYLIYRSAGRFPVFFDGRSDLYGAEFLKQYSRAMQVKPGWRTWWDGFHFTHALLPVDSPLIAALEQIGWRRIYTGPAAVLLADNGT
ncbi:MAG TPA: hypothetical protein VG456_04100 [Candidatus Sulfopaludibacter sp.]|nr:hypothetical protein [Candidatus Sulfopaludibacter sp.]